MKQAGALVIQRMCISVQNKITIFINNQGKQNMTSLNFANKQTLIRMITADVH